MKKGEKRKQELLDIAYKMFLSNGYENTSVDEIIEAAGIAKGTYYYYFESKEAMLEEVIGMMIDIEVSNAKLVLESDAGVPQKIAGIIASLRPAEDESTIENALNRPENIVMHDKINRMIVEKAVPLLSEAVSEGAREGIFACDNIPERVRMLLVISNETFNEREYTDADVDVFIEITEKLFNAQPGTMAFVRALIR